MTQDLSQYLESSRSVTILILNVTISVISLQSAISLSPRGVRSSYFTGDMLWHACFISGAQTCPIQREPQQLTSEVHQFQIIRISPPEPPQTGSSGLLLTILASQNAPSSTQARIGRFSKNPSLRRNRLRFL